MHSLVPWLVFGSIILTVLAIDLGLFHRKSKSITLKEALIWTCVWVSLALAFNIGIYIYMGKDPALKFLAGYLLEESLSVDNLFVFLLIFKYFHVQEHNMHKILFWGILGAIVMRALFIAGGLVLINNFSWMMYVFGVFLIYTGIQLGLKVEQEIHPDHNPVIRLVQRFYPVYHDKVTDKFFVTKNGVRHATTLFLALIAVETTDVIFALDSIPAIFAITTDPFIVYTSNIFAILGLRSLFFMLQGLMKLFHHLHYGLALILIIIGIKMLIADYYHIPIQYALLIIVGILGVSIISSILNPKSK